jgi:hypothetical protein
VGRKVLKILANNLVDATAISNSSFSHGGFDSFFFLTSFNRAALLLLLFRNRSARAALSVEHNEIRYTYNKLTYPLLGPPRYGPLANL